jgi:hypothetical protein
MSQPEALAYIAEHWNRMVAAINALHDTAGVSRPAYAGRETITPLGAQMIQVALVDESNQNVAEHHPVALRLEDLTADALISADEPERSTRLLRGSAPDGKRWGNWVVAQEPGASDRIIRAVYCGVTLARVVRPWADVRLDRVDLWADQIELYVQAAGAGQILWEEEVTAGTHWALIDIQQAPEAVPIVHSGSTTIPHLGPCVPAGSSGFASGRWSVESPQDASPLPSHSLINVGGELTAGSNGVAIVNGPATVRVDASVDVDDTVGPVDDKDDMSSDGGGWRVLAYLGAADGESQLYAVVRRDAVAVWG